jgi:hypothetical protein
MAPRRIRRLRLIGLALALGVVVSESILGQVTSSGPVLFRIVLPHSMVCVGERQLEVETELRNISEHEGVPVVVEGW